MKAALGRFGAIFFNAGGWIITSTRFALDLIGYSTLPEDAKVAAGYVPIILDGLMTVPAWAYFAVMVASTIWLAHVSWPRQALPATDRATAALLPPSQPASRRLLPDQKSAITSYIKSANPEPRELIVFHEGASEECAKYAADLAAAIALTGIWTSYASPNILGRTGEIKNLKIGVQDAGNLSVDARILAEALKRSGVRFDWWPTPPMKPDGLHLYVGFRDDD